MFFYSYNNCLEGVTQLKIGVPKESFPGEQRVALIPGNVAALLKICPQIAVLVEKGAGLEAGYTDVGSDAADPTLAQRDPVSAEAEIILQVQAPGDEHITAAAALAILHEGQTLIGILDPLAHPAFAHAI